MNNTLGMSNLNNRFFTIPGKESDISIDRYTEEYMTSQLMKYPRNDCDSVNDG